MRNKISALIIIVLGLSILMASPGFATGLDTNEDQQLIQLAAIQMTLNLDDFWSRTAFETKIDSLMAQVSNQLDPSLPALVVFPEDVGLMLLAQDMERSLGNVTSIEQAIESATKARIIPVLWTRLIRGVSWVPALYLSKHQTIAETYFETFAKMADKYNVYIVGGSVILPPYEITDGIVNWSKPVQHRVYNTAYLFGPDGTVMGKQDKVHLIELEKEAALDLTSGSLDDIIVFDTEVGKIGIAICLDAFKDDVIERLVDQGAEILVQPSANPGPWSIAQQDEWMESAHQQVFSKQQFTYGINPMMNGDLWDISFYGQSSIVVADPELTNEQGYLDLAAERGFLSLTGTDDQEEILVVTVPLP